MTELPYPAADMVVMKTEAYKHYIEILPAALLSQRRARQPITRNLPAGSCLLITNPNNKEQTKLMQTVTQSFRQQGKQVFFWTMEEICG